MRAEGIAPEVPERQRPVPDLGRLGTEPDWKALDPFQRTMTRSEFVYLLNHCYARDPKQYEGLIEILPDRALITRQSNDPDSGYYPIFFRLEPDADEFSSAALGAYWRDCYELDDVPAESGRVLEGVKIAIDPGHIGGDWVNWDDRHFSIGEDTIEVREGEMNLRVAKILERDLTGLGAQVYLTRATNDPVTEARPEEFVEAAREYLVRKRRIPSTRAIRDTTKYMFAVSSEIRCRGQLVNEGFRPDLALCLHFDASPWGSRPSFRSPNHLHLLINGCYNRWEIKEDDTRFEMIRRLLHKVYYQELAMAREFAVTMRDETRLPAFKYQTAEGKKVCDSDYIWARNLLANRSFMCPVIFFEPYCMNHREVHARVQAGEYRGLREFNGVYRKNIYQEYADGVTAGLINYFKRRR